MMKLTLADPKYLKDSISIISDLVSSGKISVKSDKIEFIAMDSANVALIIFQLFSTTFIEYEVSSDVDINIDMTMLKQILRRAKSNDILTLELEDNRLKIIMKGKSTKTFYIPLLESEEREQKIPSLTFPVTVNTESSIISEAIEDAEIISESVAFVCTKEMLSVEADGDLSKAKIDISSDDKTKIECPDMAKARYSIEYLKKMITASKLADKVTLQFNNDYPMKMEFKDIDKLSMAFILAPRVDND